MRPLASAVVFWLLPGPRYITPHIGLDIHTMIFGVIFTLLGVQILSIGAFAKVFSYAERFDRRPFSLRRILRRFTLEFGLLLGGALCVAPGASLFCASPGAALALPFAPVRVDPGGHRS